MWEALGNSVKVILEKYLVPTVLSIGIAIGAVLAIDSDNWMLAKIGKLGFCLFIFCIAFIGTQVLYWAFCFERRRLIRKKNENDMNAKREKERKHRLIYMWGKIDNMDPEDRKFLMEAINSGNKPYVMPQHSYRLSPIFSDPWVVSSTVHSSLMEGVETMNQIDSESILNNCVKLYKLREDVYEDLKYSKEKYGRISNFF